MCAQAASFGVYSGASYQPIVAPNSWGVAFGTQLAPTTAIATLTSAGQWPTTLGGVTVQVDGQPAEIFYISPGQINFLVPALTGFGTVTVVIANAGGTQTSTVNLQNTAVGIFTSDSSGAGPGAILNGVTGAAPPFLVVTPENGGGDLRTRLAVYCTGLRYAGNPTEDASVTNVAAHVSAQGADSAGHPYNFTVEYAGGSDPAFPGLDQVNIVLPAALDGAGIITLTITADDDTSNKVTFQVNSLPASQIALTGFSLSTNETTGGTPVTGTVSLNGLARMGGFPVSVRSSQPTLAVPVIVTVPQGQVSTTFTISTPTTGTVQSATITAQATTVVLTAPLQIDPSNLPQLTLFTLASASVQGGTSFSATIALNNTAPVGGEAIQLASDDAVVQPPAAVTVNANNSNASVTIPTSVVTTVHTVTVTATLGNTTISRQIVVTPTIQLTLAPNSVTGGTGVTGTITLGTAAPALGVNVAIASSGTAIASAPAIVNIRAGQTSASFDITTYAVTAAHTVTITATSAAVGSATASLTVNPPVTGQLTGLTVNPAKVTGGGSVTGTVTLSGPAGFGGLLVTLKSSSSLVAAAPFNVAVPQGSSSVNFTISTFKVATAQTVTIAATAGSISEMATLTVQ
jgi:uncharacterized protein (TIGR03437 family)